MALTFFHTYSVIKLVPTPIGRVFGISDIMPSYKANNQVMSCFCVHAIVKRILLNPMQRTITSDDSSVSDHGIEVVLAVAEFMGDC